MGFVNCEKCGKPLIERMPNGLWRFRYGREKKGQFTVNIDIQGSIRIVCWRRSCRHTNTLNYFPQSTMEMSVETPPNGSDAAIDVKS